ncbi:hypothetical protein CPB85DRAFT_1249836 [Mucidula mucida]|nr:hypothetical protein CPB85DRAFT_1249836 [Mucidula mucida]
MDLIVTTASRLISLVFFFALRIPRVFYPLSPVARCLAPVNVNSYSPPAPHYAFILCWPYLSLAKDIVITVGLNTTDNATAVFQPDTVTAQLNDIVVFNFTQGNHTVTQSLFATPCIPAHDANITINGFDSAFRDAGNGTAITILTVPITPEIETRLSGGVGGINVNESSFENTDAFIRNAIRLNGSDSSSSSSSSSSHTSTSSSSQSLVLRIRMVLSAP